MPLKKSSEFGPLSNIRSLSSALKYVSHFGPLDECHMSYLNNDVKDHFGHIHRKEKKKKKRPLV